MAHEVDFIAVGDGEKSGDAIALRFGKLDGQRSEQTVIVIDGGTKESGEQLVDHIKKYYKTTHVDYIVSTHPDNDHASGLTEVLDKLSVGTLLLHRPWEHASDIQDMFKDGRLTEKGLEQKLAKSLQAARDLETLADEKGVSIVEPFAGVSTTDGSIRVLGPTEEYYESLLPNFRGTPEPKAEATIFQKIVTAAEEAIKWVEETLNIETLDDSGETSAENNSSAILLVSYDGHTLLFTGDAGIPAITQAADYAEGIGIDLTSLTFLQVPHHGSKRNVGPTILNRVKAPTAFISAAPKGTPKHPSKKVTNALIRRGSKVHATQGESKQHHKDAPDREGWVPSTPIPFYNQVED